MKNQIKGHYKEVKSRWYLWLFPILAVLLTGYLFFQKFYNHGRTIAITFEEVSVIQPEKTKIRFRGVDIGTVRSLAISDDHKSVIVYCVLGKDAEEFAVEGSKFWVVTPKVSLAGLTGLDTIFSGPYIEASPGKPDAPIQTEFKARPDSEVKEFNEATTPFMIETSTAESISSNDAITFRGINIGTIGKLSLTKTAQGIDVQIHIQNKYVKLVRTNTVFWRKVGIQAKLGLFGSNIKVNSLDSIMHGGMEMFTPDKPGEVAKPHTKFVLASEAPKDVEKWNPNLELESTK